MEDKVTLIVKAPNQSVPDQRLECEADWEVSRLKEFLSTAHPSKPRVSEQRLIYSGHLLADHLRLRAVLRHPAENNAYTLHLVCSPSRQTNLPTPSTLNPTQASARLTDTPAMATATASQEPTRTPSLDPSTPPSPDAAASNGDSTDGLRRRNVNGGGEAQSVPTPQGIEASAGYPAGYPASTQATLMNLMQANTTGDPIQQMATMQQIYASYMAYMQYIQMGGSIAAWPQQLVHHLPTPYGTPSAAAAEAASPLQALQQPQADQNAQPQQPEQQPEQPQAQAQPQIRMNAQGGEVLDDDEENEGLGRDWLDWIYVLSRMVVLLSIVYFYSTINRFMIVVSIALLLYLYQAGWFRPARRAADQIGAANGGQDDRNNNVNNNNNNNNVDDERPQAGGGDGVEGAEEGEGGRTAEEGGGGGAEELQGRQSLLALSWTFLTTFFTSLIPEQPQVL